MRYIKLDANTKLEDMVSIAYRLKDRTPAAVTALARDALLTANPLLKKARTIGKDTVLVVPDVPGVSVSNDAVVPKRFPDTMIDDTRRNAAKLIKRLRAAAESETAVLAAVTELLRGKDAKGAVAELGDDGAALIKEATNSARKRIKESAARAERTQQAVQHMLEDMAEMQKRFGGR